MILRCLNAYLKQDKDSWLNKGVPKMTELEKEDIALVAELPY